MRTLLTLSALVAAFAATPVAAETGCTARQPRTPDAAPPLIAPLVESPVPQSALAPLAESSPWHARFAAAADALLPALRSRDERRWIPLLGGRWLGEADRKSVQMVLADSCGAFDPILRARGPVARRILGWSPPASYSAADLEEIAARSEAEALVCWSAHTGADIAWPQTAADADNRPDRPYACTRITYSVRGGAPTWRAFIEPGA